MLHACQSLLVLMEVVCVVWWCRLVLCRMKRPPGRRRPQLRMSQLLLLLLLSHLLRAPLKQQHLVRRVRQGQWRQQQQPRTRWQLLP